MTIDYSTHTATLPAKVAKLSDALALGKLDKAKKIQLEIMHALVVVDEWIESQRKMKNGRLKEN